MKKSNRYLSAKEAEVIGQTVKKNEKGRKKARYYVTDKEFEDATGNSVNSETKPNDYEPKKFVLSAWKDGLMMDIDTYCKTYDLPRNDISSYKLISHTGVPYYNIVFKENVETESIDFDKILNKHITKKKKKKKVKQYGSTSDFDTLTYTDVHVGLDTNKGKNSMYPIVWNQKSINDVANKIVKNTIKNQTSKTLIIDELGDMLDGYDGFTTRGGHKLPQNMSNEEAFDCALEFKMSLVDNLHDSFDTIVCNNICNDNHAGSFGYLVNSAFKKLVDVKYKNVEVNNYRQFINHYIIGDVCFIITHGKDSDSLKFGFKPFLDSKQIEKIDHYIKHNKLYSKAKRFIFKKGDSHQLLFDMCTSADFDYFNYGALSPASMWIQNNFKGSRQSFVLESFKGTESTIKPIFI